MAPTNSKANYKTYEAQARMVRAIVAAHPDVKWNYKEIAACYGSDMTEHALNHRFRRLRAQALIIREGRPQGFDMKHLSVEDNMPTAQDAVDKTNIAKYFGQSTADGIQFQFRGIKKDADQLRQTHSSGGDAAVRAGATIAAGAAPDSDSDVVLVKPESQYQSIFGDAAGAAPSPSTASVAGAFTERATDPVFSTAFGANLYLGSFEEAIEAYGDGEI
ncbi:hypothetical protein MBR_03820, partial [Metarhizium brunneum ARSEF 3297]